MRFIGQGLEVGINLKGKVKEDAMRPHKFKVWKEIRMLEKVRKKGKKKRFELFCFFVGWKRNKRKERDRAPLIDGGLVLLWLKCCCFFVSFAFLLWLVHVAA